MSSARGETEEERRQRLEQDRQRSQYAYDVAIKGFTWGAVYGLAGGLGASLLAQRYSASYRVLRPSLKLAGVSMALLFGGTFGAENALYRIKSRLLAKATVTRQRPFTEVLIDHRLAIFGGAVGAAVLATGWRIMQNKNLSASQKFMNIRLYGQMAGLLAIAAMAGLTAAKAAVPDSSEKRGHGEV